MKRYLFIFLACLLALGSLEVLSFALWKLVLQGDRLEANYAAMKATAGEYVYDERLQIVEPRPSSTTTYFTGEYTDTYHHAEIPPFKAGFIDNGYKPDGRPVALVFGDSLTRAQGSLDPLKNGWVEILERQLGGVHLVNMSLHSTGSAQSSQHKMYNAVAKLVPHDVVFVGFSGTNDFVDDLSDPVRPVLDPNLLPPGTDIDAFVKGNKHVAFYNGGCESMLSARFMPHLYLIFSKFVSSLLPSLYLATPQYFPICPAYGTGVSNGMPEDLQRWDRMRRSMIASMDAADQMDSLPDWAQTKKWVSFLDGMRIEVPNYLVNKRVASFVAEKAAEVNNAFYRSVAKEGKTMIIALLPSKPDIYLKALLDGEVQFSGGGIKQFYYLAKKWLNISSGLGEQYAEDQMLRDKIDIDFVYEEFKRHLDPNIILIDMIKPVRDASLSASTNIFWAMDGHLAPLGNYIIAQKLCPILWPKFGNGKVPQCKIPNSDKVAAAYGQMKVTRRGVQSHE